MDDYRFDDIKVAEQFFAEGSYRLVIVKDGQLLYAADEPRLLPLAKGLVRLGKKAQGAVVKDKVIGRAAAMLLAAFGVGAVVTPLISSGARTLLEEAGIRVQAAEEIPAILNQSGDASCPMEAMVETYADPRAGAQYLLDFFAEKKLLLPYVI